MSLDTISFETQSTITTNADAGATDQLPEITPMSLETFSLVGGGMGIMLLG